MKAKKTRSVAVSAVLLATAIFLPFLIAASLPTVGDRNWGTLLNTWLRVSHTDGGNTNDSNATITGGTVSGITLTATNATLTTPTLTTSASVSDGFRIGDSGEPNIIFDETNDYFEFSGGNLGIGTTDPNHTLDVDGTIQSEKVLERSITQSAAGPTDNLDVDDCSIILIDTTSSNVTIGGFTNGDAGQVLYLSIINPANDAILEHAEGTGNQDIYLTDSSDETITASYGGWILQCNGTHWYEITTGGAAAAAHAADHIDGGSDAIDGDKVEITATWDNITPDTTIGEADSVDDLSAILEGIDDEFGSVGTIDTSTTYAAAWNGDANAPSMNLVYDYLVQMDSDADGNLEPYNISSSDLTLSVEGEMGLKSHEDGVAYHSGSTGEVSGEVFKSHLDYIHVAFDPGAQYDSNSVVCFANLDSKVFPNGVIIDYWEVDCMLDPDVEMNLNLGYANNYDDVGDPNLIDVLDTTTGQASEDTDANINSGSAIPAGSVVFLYFDADPEGTCTQLNVDIIWHREED